jgi:spore coat protein U-like protein
MKPSVRILPLAAGAALALCVLAAPAAAQTTANLAVSAAVSQSCTITAAPLDFGTYDPVEGNLATPLDGTGTLSIACTKGSAPKIGLNSGSNADGSTRRLLYGSVYLTYELYQNSDRTVVWGNESGSWNELAAAPSRATREITVYGRVAGGQDFEVGTYTDTVTATVNF